MLFASIQTLGQANQLSRFAHDHFDDIVIGEFRHADAPTYRPLIEHFQPGFMLELTAILLSGPACGAACIAWKVAISGIAKTLRDIGPALLGLRQIP